jgi:hypothetical protein
VALHAEDPTLATEVPRDRLLVLVGGSWHRTSTGRSVPPRSFPRAEGPGPSCWSR